MGVAGGARTEEKRAEGGQKDKTGSTGVVQSTHKETYIYK